MYNLVDVLAESDGDALTWVMARVEKINTGPASVDLVIGDIGEASAVHMKKVPFLSAYAPTVGDVVHVISKKNTRALVLGISNGSTTGGGTRTTPSLRTGVEAYLNGWESPYYQKLASGLVVLGGLVKYKGSTVTKLQLFTLPPGMRPAANLHYPVLYNNELAVVQIFSDGRVEVRKPKSDSFASLAWVSLDGITFMAEQ